MSYGKFANLLYELFKDAYEKDTLHIDDARTGKLHSVKQP